MILSELIKKLIFQVKSMKKDELEEIITKRLGEYHKKMQNLKQLSGESRKKQKKIAREIKKTSATIENLNTIQEIIVLEVIKVIKEWLDNLQRTIGREDPTTINLFGVFYSVQVVSAMYTKLQGLSNMLSLFAKENPELIMEQPRCKGQLLSDAFEVEDTDESVKSLAYLERETLPPEKDWNLYILTFEGVSLLNIGKLSERPGFKVVLKKDQLPWRIECAGVCSKYYMLGGEPRRMGKFEVSDSIIQKPLANCDVIPFYPNGGVSFDPSKDIIPGFVAPKLDPIVVTLNERIYVLARKRYYPSVGSAAPAPLFEVFDPICRSWDSLPEPPFYCRARFCSPWIKTYYAWGQKLVICLYERSYVFDTSKDLWMSEEDMYGSEMKLPILSSVVKFEGFLIGKPLGSQKLVAYKLSSNDYPYFFRELNELQKLFYPGLYGTWSLMFQFSDVDRYCFIYSGFGAMKEMWWICVAVFRLYENPDSPSELTAVLESHKFYRHYDCPYIRSAFVMRVPMSLLSSFDWFFQYFFCFM